MNSSSEDRLIERIYDAAIVPGLWKPVLEEISQRADAAAGLFSQCVRDDVGDPDGVLVGSRNRGATGTV